LSFYRTPGSLVGYPKRNLIKNSRHKNKNEKGNLLVSNARGFAGSPSHLCTSGFSVRYASSQKMNST
jgi:hypothetical protein